MPKWGPFVRLYMIDWPFRKYEFWHFLTMARKEMMRRCLTQLKDRSPLKISNVISAPWTAYNTHPVCEMMVQKKALKLNQNSNPSMIHFPKPRFIFIIYELTSKNTICLLYYSGKQYGKVCINYVEKARIKRSPPKKRFFMSF